MLDNDNLTYSYQKRSPQPPSKRALLTHERAQKLDLLIHLLTNLQQSLIVCGPEGIGKTTLLQQLQANRDASWQFCNLKGSETLSFEGVLQQLGQTLELSYGYQLDLNMLRRFCEQQKVILIIDDADQLVPGLAGELTRFAESLQGLRLVLAMNNDSFHLKSTTDDTLNDCHLIELPPLNRKQCFDFIKNLSVQPNSALPFNNITDDLIGELYRTTHGIPGKLLADFPLLERHNARRRSWALWLGIIVISVSGAYVALSVLPKSNSPEESIDLKQPPNTMPQQRADLQSQSPPVNVEPVINVQSSPVETINDLPTDAKKDTASSQATSSITPTVMATPSFAPAPEKPVNAVADTALHSVKAIEMATSTVQDKPQAPSQAIPAPIHKETESTLPAEPSSKKIEASDKSAANTAQPLVKQMEAKVETAIKPEPPPTATQQPTATATATATADDDSTWINEQAGDRFTLQVVTLSTEKAVQRFMIRYADYASNLKYYIVNRGTQQKYVVIYGSFESATEARQTKQNMPGEFKRALEKSFSSIQKSRR